MRRVGLLDLDPHVIRLAGRDARGAAEPGVDAPGGALGEDHLAPRIEPASAITARRPAPTARAPGHQEGGVSGSGRGTRGRDRRGPRSAGGGRSPKPSAWSATTYSTPRRRSRPRAWGALEPAEVGAQQRSSGEYSPR